MTRFTICAAAFALALSTQVSSHESHGQHGGTVELQYKIYEIPYVPVVAGDIGEMQVRSVNDRGEVLIGSWRLSDSGALVVPRWFIWRGGRRITEFVSPDPTMRFLELIKINNRSEVVGNMIDDPEGTPAKLRAILYRRGQPTVLAALPGYENGITVATSLNDWGEVAGFGSTNSFNLPSTLTG